MIQHSHCPACGKTLSTENLCGRTVVCGCGWTHSYAAEKGANRVVVTMVLMCSLFVGSFIHAVNWDTHFFAIIPLKLKELSGMAQTQDLEKIVEICSLRSKQDCVESAYRKMYEINPSNIDALAELARVQFAGSHLAQVASTLEEYFTKGGKSADAAYDYARALAHMGRYEDALRYFKFVLKSKPKASQVNVARSYIQTLIQGNKLPQAKSAIEHFRRRSVSSAFFMEKEYKEVLKRLGQARTVAHSMDADPSLAE